LLGPNFPQAACRVGAKDIEQTNERQGGAGHIRLHALVFQIAGHVHADEHHLKTTDTVTKTTQFTVSNPVAVFNKADKSTILDNCPNPIIKNINGVTPFPIGGVNNPFAGNDGNIYIVGVSPVVFYGISDTDAQGSVKIQTDNVTLESLCTQKHKLLPPVDICAFTDPLSKNIYYSKPALAAHDPTKCSFERPERDAGSYFESSRPEYYFWPQFVKPEYYELYWKK
jgi:hypothetical protein